MRKWLLLAVWRDRTITLAGSYHVEVEAYQAAELIARNSPGKPNKVMDLVIIPARRIHITEDGRLEE